jgi:hypothetical protein
MSRSPATPGRYFKACPDGTVRREDHFSLALLWQIYSRSCSLQIHFGNADIAAALSRTRRVTSIMEYFGLKPLTDKKMTHFLISRLRDAARKLSLAQPYVDEGVTSFEIFACHNPWALGVLAHIGNVARLRRLPTLCPQQPQPDDAMEKLASDMRSVRMRPRSGRVPRLAADRADDLELVVRVQNQATSDVIRSVISDRIEQAKKDPSFQDGLRDRIERAQRLLGRR